MKKLSLLSLIFFGIASSLYGRVNPYVDNLLPRGRQALAKAMLESSAAYDAAGNKKRADEYRKIALEVFPVGDEAHALARSLNTPLDDEKTYTNFSDKGDVAYKARNYSVALASYLMALELRQPITLYEKLQQSYLKLGNTGRASDLQKVIDASKVAPAPEDSYYEDSYRAESEESYPQTYPLDGYGEESYKANYDEEAPME